MSRPLPAAPVLVALTGRVPYYGGGAVVTGSLIFLILLAAFVGVGFRRRRR